LSWAGVYGYCVRVRAYILLFLLVSALGAGALWVGRQHSLQRCRKAAHLVSQASVPQRWLKAAAEDRFLTQLLHEGPIAETLKHFSSQASALSQDFLTWHFFPEARTAFVALGATPPVEEKKFLAALQAVAAPAVPRACTPALPDEKLMNLLGQSEAAWKSRQAEVKLAKASFRRDQEIYCHAESLTNRLRAVLTATEESCARQKVECRPALEPLEQEIADIEKQKEFNKNKLSRKWSADILEGLQCS
jgi:hypothetical protein